MAHKFLIAVFLRVLCASVVICPSATSDAAPLKAGAFALDITPSEFPVIVNGGFVEAVATKANDRLHARALVLDDGHNRIAIVVVDSCMLPRDLLDDAKSRAAKTTGIPVARMLISATHTHSAPSAMGCLGSDADERYVKVLPGLLARAIEKANAHLAPAKIGWTVAQAPDMTATRRYVFRLDRPRIDPFGEPTVFANMHPGYDNPDAIGPTGPTDPGVSIVSFRHADGRPLAVLANFSMHYVGTTPLSADYYGLFCEKIARLVGGDESFVGIMSQGTSGDAWLADYSRPQPKEKWTIETFSTAMAQKVHGALARVEYRDDVPIAMKEGKLTLKRRVPDEKRLAWARQRVEKLGGAKPREQPDIYAREAIFLHDDPVRELKLQAIRIGDLGITAIPNEVYALTGLKLKAASPLPVTFNMSLANGSEGYIPPPEQHPLGGYTTWPARTAALEPQAEPKIVDAMLSLLEEVSGKKRKAWAEPANPYAEAIAAAKPVAYFRMGDFAGPACLDAGPGRRHGTYEPGVVFHLPGVEAAAWSSRAAHFAGGRMRATLPDDIVATPDRYTVAFFFWNGLANEARPVTAYLFSRGPDADKDAPGDHLGIGGNYEDGANRGRLILFNGNRADQLLAGRTQIAPKTWHHVALLRDGRRASVYLDGKPEMSGEIDVTSDARSVFLGGRCDGFANLQGKLDEVALFNSPLNADEVATHFKASGLSVAAAPEPPPAALDTAQFRRSFGPLSPGESRKKIHLLDGYAIELMAAEPLVIDPVAIDWGPDGKLWVAEMHDYPYGMDGKGKPGGRIKFLEDTDGDGKYDRATTFMENVRMPNGVLAWRDGVLVTAAPDILYARDTDGDGKADQLEVLFTGFKEGNPQLRVNGLRWGLDNWVYCANGWSAGVVVSKKTGRKLDLKGRDLRIRPDTGEMELVSGVSQFGRERDDAGNWFGVDNAHPLFNYVLEDRYVKRNPQVASPDPKNQLLGQQPRVYPRSVLQRRFIGLDHHGHYTSACGISVYRDSLLLPPGQSLHAFICEPVHNLIQHQVLSPTSATFEARRAPEEADRDFVASEDPWFRPVMTRCGPDGALWVVDMYRYMIEHPDWLDATGKRALAPFYRDGDDKGRIYRIYRQDAPPRPIPRPKTAGTAGLVAALESPSGHTRDQAQMMLVWNGDGAAVPSLEKQIAESKDPLARLHALCALDALASNADLKSQISDFKSRILPAAIRDPHPAVRVNAVRIAEHHLRENPALLEALAGLADDADARVRIQLACSLGESDSDAAGRLLAKVAAAREGSADPWMSAAATSSALPHLGTLADSLLSDGGGASGLFDGVMLTAIGKADLALAARFLARLGRDDVATLRRLATFLDALEAHKLSLEQMGEAAGKAVAILDRAADVATDVNEPLDRRLAALQLVGRRPARREMELAAVGTLLSPRAPPELQAAAVRAAARIGHPGVSAMLLKEWPTHPPALRSAIADVLLSRQPWALELAKSPAARDLDFSRKQRLLNHGNADVKKMAKATLDQPAAVSADRQKVIDQYQSATSSNADAIHGKQIYLENCATCHRSGGEGNEIGPSLLSVRDWTRENLLTAILDPDRTVEPRYLAYTVTTSDGQTLTGVITNESAAGLAIKTLDAKEHQVPRAAVKSLAATGHSLMPQGFESALTPKDVSDLIAHIQSPENR
jgi:putative membrane-bound dehydrogenase-like protein